MKTLAELQSACRAQNIEIPPATKGKAPFVAALRQRAWENDHPGVPLEKPITPMLLKDWADLSPAEVATIERDDSGWGVQEKRDGVRAILHVTPHGVRLTGRSESRLTFRPCEYQDNLPHLTVGLETLTDTILDGELVCPKATLNTGTTVTTSALQATVAILAASPGKAADIQSKENANLVFVAFDILRYRGHDVTAKTLRERIELLEEVVMTAEQPYLEFVPTYFTDKAFIHELLIAEGKEGTVWKKLDRPYTPGKRVAHWLKRKRGIEVEAVVTGFKLGTAGRGNENLIGAVEFSAANDAGEMRPIAWVCNWTDDERHRMTSFEGDRPTLNPEYRGRKAVIAGQDIAGKSGRIRHARLTHWLV